MKIKKIASVFLALTLITFSFSNVSAQSEGHWAKDSIERMTSLEIVQGDENGDFLPDNFITRAELFTILNRLTKISNISGKTFPDVAPWAWYKNQVDIAVTDGYVSGYSDETIRPENYITRQEAAVLIARLFGTKEYNEPDFIDKNEIEVWAIDGINSITHLGLISGYEDNSFKPNANITRAEVVTILDKLIGKIQNIRETVKDETIDKSLIVTVGNVVFENVTVNGNVYITNAASNDEIRFVNSKIDGSIVYGNKNDKAVVLENTLAKSIVLGGSDAKAVLTGKTSVESIYIDGASSITSPDYTGSAIENIYVSGDAKIGINAKNVIVLEKSDVEILDGAIVDSLTIEKDATGSDITATGSLGKIKCDAKNCTLNGSNISQGYESTNIANQTQKYSFSYPVSSSKGSGGGSSSGGGSGSGGSSSSGSGSSSSKPSSGAASNENKTYEIESIALSDGFEFETAFDKDETEYEIEIDYDIPSLEFTVKFTQGAKVTINDTEVTSETPFEVLDIPSGESEIKIVIFDGIRTLKTYTVKVTKGYPSPEGTIEALNTILKNTQNADEDATSILEAFGNAKLEGAVILLASYYKAEYDIVSVDGDLTQRQFMTLLSKVNGENQELLSKVIGIKDDNGFVYSQNLTMTEGGMYKIGVKYAATSTENNKKLAVYIDGLKYESDEINLDSSNGWVDTVIKVPLLAGENELFMYAETKDDGNFGLIIKEITQTGEKLPVEALRIEAENADCLNTTVNQIAAGYTLVYDTYTAVGGGNIAFKFNSPVAQKLNLKLSMYKGAASSDWILAFFNPVKIPEAYSLDMVEGVDYPSISEAIYSDATWMNKGVEIVANIEVDAQKGENVVWFPARNLLCTNNEETDVYMYVYPDTTKKANWQTIVDYVEITPNDYDVTVIE